MPEEAALRIAIPRTAILARRPMLVRAMRDSD